MILDIKKYSNEGLDSFLNIGSVRTLFDELEKLKKDSSHIYFFRGHSNSSYKLIPSIYRNRGWIENEDILFKELILRCPNEFLSKESTFQTLVKMQHYSLPTRLLDVTTNPLVALYFASLVEKNKTESGELLAFRVPKKEVKYFDSDTVSVISNISRSPFNFVLPAVKGIEEFNGSNKIKLLLHEIKSEKPYFESKIMREHLESAVFVKPKLDNARIIRQDGAFILFGIENKKEYPAKVPDHYYSNVLKSRLLIKHSEKKKIMQQLESLGVSHATIYPEIDKVAEYIKEAYWSESE